MSVGENADGQPRAAFVATHQAPSSQSLFCMTNQHAFSE
jgi:hypothetical protein